MKEKFHLKTKPCIHFYQMLGLEKSKKKMYRFLDQVSYGISFHFFFGIIGGIVAYIGVKDDDKEMATNLLIFGIIWTLILFAISFYIFVVMFF